LDVDGQVRAKRGFERGGQEQNREERAVVHR